MQFVQKEQKLRSEPFPGLMKREQKTQDLGMSLMQHPKIAPTPPPAPVAPEAGPAAPAPAARKPRATKKTAAPVEAAPAPAPSETTPRATTAGKQKPRKLL